jgi:hypothetical protein
VLTKEPLNPLIGSGTCLFVRTGNNFAVAAIDSRKNTPTGSDDLTCKITCLDDFTVFLCQGLVGGWGNTASDVAKAHFAKQHESTKALYKLASDWSSEMCQQLATLDKTDPFTKDALEQGTKGVFLGHSATGNLLVLVASIEEHDSKFVASIKSAASDESFYTGEYEPFFEEVLSGTTARAANLRQSVNLPEDDESKRWALRAAACVHAAIKWSGSCTIGGEIATIILRQGKKYEWVYRPSYC